MDPLLHKIDCVQLPVPDLEAGLAFYCDQLGLELKWRRETQAGLVLGDSELVLSTEPRGLEVDLLVESAVDAAARVVAAGGRVLVDPFDIPVGRVVVVEDPFANPLVLLDLSKGTFDTDDDGNVTGVS